MLDLRRDGRKGVQTRRRTVSSPINSQPVREVPSFRPLGRVHLPLGPPPNRSQPFPGPGHARSRLLTFINDPRSSARANGVSWFGRVRATSSHGIGRTPRTSRRSRTRSWQLSDNYLPSQRMRLGERCRLPDRRTRPSIPCGWEPLGGQRSDPHPPGCDPFRIPAPAASAAPAPAAQLHLLREAARLLPRQVRELRCPALRDRSFVLRID